MSNHDTNADRERVTNALSWSLRDLTSNLIRITRGAGKSHEIGNQLVSVIRVMNEYKSIFGYWPASHEIDRMLRLAPTQQHYSIIRGALQVTASTLVDQNTQRFAGESEMHEGIERIVRAALKEG